MPELSPHLDDFVLLRYTAGELEEPERQAAVQHLEGCSDCSRQLLEARQLDAELQAIAAEDASAFADPDGLELPAGDPFRKRPEPWNRARDRSFRPERLVESAVEAARQGAERRVCLLETIGDARQSRAALEDLSLSDPADRFALLYALQEAGPRVAQGPAAMRRFAEDALQRLRARPAGESTGDQRLAERVTPRLLLLGQAHLLGGQACYWTGEYQAAEAHCRIAYSSFARGGSETDLAFAEMLEAQRRFMIGSSEEALILARRASATFRLYGLEDAVARARGVEGMALFGLGRVQESLEAFRSTLGVLEAQALWSNYVSALNNVAVCLVKLGRLDEARREYARVLRRLSRKDHRSFLASVRHGLAEVLFAAGRYRQAAHSLMQARRLYVECGMRASVFSAWLFEVESWALSGDLARAREALAAFQSAVAADPSLDFSTARQIEKALSGLDPSFANIAELRKEAESFLPPSWRGMSA
jgi:tetratricopeptide (TPR) repeat protein